MRVHSTFRCGEVSKIMMLRASINGFLTAIAAVSALASLPAPAIAQGMSEWGMWERPRRIRPPPPDYNGYDAQDSYRAAPRYRRPSFFRRTERGYDDGDRRYPRYDARRFDDRRTDDRDSDDRFGDQYGPPDRAREPDIDADQSKTPGADGGPQPYIEAAAPPAVAFRGPYTPGSIVIDTGGRKLYYVTSPASALAYPIGVGREGFSWTGSEKVSRVADWPDWYPPAEMRERKPELPERMLGGVNNPLGAKAIYLGTTLYRIHGTNDPKSIGRAESSGCFRMLNAHVLHLASLVQVGAQVTVVRALNGNTVASTAQAKPPPVVQRAAPPRPLPARPGWRDFDDDGYQWDDPDQER